MKKTTKKILFTLLPIALGFFLIVWSLSLLTPSDRTEITAAFRNADYFWIVVSLFLGLLSHISRAYRWYFFLEPLGYKPRFLNSLFTIFIAYFINLLLPRVGEVARGTAISKYESIPFDKAFGTIVAERIIDVVMLLLIIVIAFFYQFDILKEVLTSKVSGSFHIFSLLFLLLFIGVLFYYLIRKSKKGFLKKVKEFIKGLLEGVKSVAYMRRKGIFIAHTLFIWLMYILMFYTVSLSLPETSNLSIGAIITGFVMGALSMAAINGGLGAYPIGVQQALILYDVSSNPALTLGWLMWSAQTLMILVLGGISFLALPLYNRKAMDVT